MYKLFSFLMLVLAFNFAMIADPEPIIIHSNDHTHNHFNLPVIADWPDAVYYDSDEMEIDIEADGVSSYYYVEIISDSLNMTVISTQISGYGDTIDVSSLPTGSYTIVITSQYNNQYEEQFYI